MHQLQRLVRASRGWKLQDNEREIWWSLQQKQKRFSIVSKNTIMWDGKAQRCHKIIMHKNHSQWNHQRKRTENSFWIFSFELIRNSSFQVTNWLLLMDCWECWGMKRMCDDETRQEEIFTISKERKKKAKDRNEVLTTRQIMKKAVSWGNSEQWRRMWTFVDCTTVLMMKKL